MRACSWGVGRGVLGWDGMGRASSGNIDSGEKRGRGSLICDGDGSSCEVFRLFGD